MKKDKLISKILKVTALIIILIGIYVFLDYKLWKEVYTDFQIYLKTFVSILVLGFSGTLYGIATLIEKN